jgi:hypothetical protein
MRRAALLALLGLVHAACGGDSPDSKAASTSSGKPVAGSAGDAEAREMEALTKRALTAADVEKYLEFASDLSKARDAKGYTEVAKAHGLGFQRAMHLAQRVTVAYISLSIKGGAGKPTGTAAEDVEVVRPFADRIKEATRKK